VASVYAVGRNKKSQKRALVVVGRQLASQGFIKLVDLLMPELRSGGDLTDYLEAGEISGEDALDLLRRAGILKHRVKQVA
jgi:hypothetical protein